MYCNVRKQNKSFCIHVVKRSLDMKKTHISWNQG